MNGSSIHTIVPLDCGVCQLGADHLYGKTHSPEKRIPFTMYAFLVQGAGRTLLVDLGPKSLGYTNDMLVRYGFFRQEAGGVKRPDDAVQRFGNVLDQLEERGIPPAAVEHIILTHMHADHHGMDDARDGGAIEDFPRAVYHVSRIGWEENLAKRTNGSWNSYVDFAFADALVRLEKNGRVRFEDDAEVVPGVKTIHLGGHAVCSQAVTVNTASGLAVIPSDEIYRYDLLREGVLACLYTTPEALLAATDRLVDLADRGAILLPIHDPALHEMYGSAGDGWLEQARERTREATKGYREQRRAGRIRFADH